MPKNLVSGRSRSQSHILLLYHAANHHCILAIQYISLHTVLTQGNSNIIKVHQIGNIYDPISTVITYFTDRKCKWSFELFFSQTINYKCLVQACHWNSCIFSRVVFLHKYLKKPFLILLCSYVITRNNCLDVDVLILAK